MGARVGAIWRVRRRGSFTRIQPNPSSIMGRRRVTLVHLKCVRSTMALGQALFPPSDSNGAANNIALQQYSGKNLQETVESRKLLALLLLETHEYRAFRRN